MDYESVHDQFHLTTSVSIGGLFGCGPKSNVWSSSRVKTEMVDGYQSGRFQVKLEPSHHALNGADGLGMCDCKSLSPEAEAGAWLRDEPVDIPASNAGLLGSWCASTVGRNGVGIGGIEEAAMETCGTADMGMLGSPGCPPELSEDVSLAKGASNLLTQLRATKIRESILREAIRRLGGGQKGLRAVIKLIFVWLREKNRSSLAGDSRDSRSVSSDAVDQFLCCNVGQGGVVPGLREDVNFSMNSMARPRENGSGEYGEVVNYEHLFRTFVPEPGRLDGVMDAMSVPGPGLQGPEALSTDASQILSGCWIPSDGLQCTRGRTLSPPPDPTALLNVAPGISVYEDGHSQKNKIRRLSTPPAVNSSSQSSSELPSPYGVIGSSTPSDHLGIQNIFGPAGTNPFAPGGAFSMSPSSTQAVDPHSLDSGPFTSFGLQIPMLIDDNLHGCGLVDRLGCLYPGSPENSLDQPKAVVTTQASPAASTRLARKIRMDRNRKAASHHTSRASSRANASAEAASGSVWPLSSSASPRNTPQRQEFSPPEGQHSVKDQRDKEHLQFLLQKVLRPSDVGNLGRIVLPKKDAESHLPWLAAREGLPLNCEDYETGEKIMLRYRFWPNNKSRMYLLENTGDFVKKHNLQESDRLLIYRNQRRGIYIIRGRKSRDCQDFLSRGEEGEREGKDRSQQNSPEGTCCSGEKDVETSVTIAASGLEAPMSESVVACTSIVTQADDLLNFADLPDAPMGEGAENLVRFPSLEAFDVELLELVPPPAVKKDIKASQLISGQG